MLLDKKIWPCLLSANQHHDIVFLPVASRNATDAQDAD